MTYGSSSDLRILRQSAEGLREQLRASVPRPPRGRSPSGDDGVDQGRAQSIVSTSVTLTPSLLALDAPVSPSQEEE